jgi:hypothetical protein
MDPDPIDLYIRKRATADRRSSLLLKGGQKSTERK